MNVKPFASGQAGINPDSWKEPHVKVKTRRRILCTCIKRPMEGADDLTRGSQSFICRASEAGKLISQGQHVGKIIREKRLMGTAQWAQKSEQADIEIFLATLYKIKCLKTFIKSTTLIVKHKVLGKHLKQEKVPGNENKIHETLAPPASL